MAIGIKDVKEILARIEGLSLYYSLLIKDKRGLIPRHQAAAIAVLLLGHFDEKWHPIIMSRIGAGELKDKSWPVDYVGEREVFPGEDAHISGSTRWFTDQDKGTLQTAMRILCKDEYGAATILEVYSRPVPLYQREGDLGFVNVDETTASRELRLLRYARQNKLQVLGWIPWLDKKE